MDNTEFPYRYDKRGDRKNQLLRIVDPGKGTQLVLVEFEDKTRETVDRNHFKRLK